MPTKKAPFDQVTTIYTGPDRTPPNTPYRFDVPCRVVVQSVFYPSPFPLSLRLAWVTMDDPPALEPAYEWDGTNTTIRYGTADRLGFGPSFDPVWVVLMNELASHPSGGAYWRCWIAPDIFSLVTSDNELSKLDSDHILSVVTAYRHLLTLNPGKGEED